MPKPVVHNVTTTCYKRDVKPAEKSLLMH